MDHIKFHNKEYLERMLKDNLDLLDYAPEFFKDTTTEELEEFKAEVEERIQLLRDIIENL